MSSLLVLIACSDFGLAKVEDPRVAEAELDTGAEVPEVEQPGDSGTPPLDTAAEEPVEEVPEADTAAPPAEETQADDPPPEDDCTETDDLIYVIARDDGVLHTFDPASLSFDSLGRVNCGTGETPGSMSVSRDGVAYVRYADNSLYAVDLATMSCARTSYSDRATRFDSFGMGYSTDSSDTWREQLYVANEDSLGILDLSTGDVATLGRMASQSELTGNADGELWAMLPLEQPAELVQIDKANAHVLTTIELRAFPDPSDIDTFAFATWSGDFYVFVREHGMGRSTDVYKVTSGGSMSVVMTDIGFDVVGAGTSTCAPS